MECFIGYFQFAPSCPHINLNTIVIFTTRGNRNTFEEPYPRYFNIERLELEGAPLRCGGQGGRQGGMDRGGRNLVI